MPDFLRLDKEAFAASPSDSIDYAVMERTDSAAVLPIDVGWNDVGSWSALWAVVEQDGDGNAHRGDVLARDCRGTLAIGDKRLIALIGLEDTVVIDTDDAVLVAHKDRVQEVKEIVSALKQRSARRRPGTARCTGPGAATTASTAASASRSSASW
jgi:mannose-1-phosphate guanylyltransferase/mannose-6-phosphate isomerase